MNDVPDWRAYLVQLGASGSPPARGAGLAPRRFNLLLLGQEGAGKTTLLQSLQAGGKVDVSKDQSTDGIVLSSLRLGLAKRTARGGLPITLHCYDFAGQEI